MPIPKPFPNIKLDFALRDANPAIQLFGRRFYTDQSILEYLSEFLLVCHSPKSIGKNKSKSKFNTILPPWDELQCWDQEEIHYYPPVRLPLKLFAFLGVSKLDTRHTSHTEHYKLLIEKLKDVVNTDGTIEKQDMLRTLENLFLGFQGVGFDRTWCAQTFYPISSTLLIQETLWNDTQAKSYDKDLTWDHMVSGFKKYFTVSQHRFLARGGELLYLQLCNAFRDRGFEPEKFFSEFNFSKDEREPESLYKSLESNLKKITGQAPPVLDQIALLIDGIDGFTTNETNSEDDSVACAWCPEESWPEGYLLAVELNRVCSALIDPVERIELLMLGCALHVLRSLCAQSVRYAKMEENKIDDGGGLGYAWIVSDPDGNERTLKHLSQRNLQVIQKIIQQALRCTDIEQTVKQLAKKTPESLYKEADRRYGHKLFVSLGKKLEMIIPQRGPGARFVFNDKIIRYLVLSLVRPGERTTYDDFKAALYNHYGIALDGIELQRATAWSDLPQLQAAGVDMGGWLVDMLKASGFLIHLSDACSLVTNPFGASEAA